MGHQAQHSSLAERQLAEHAQQAHYAHVVHRGRSKRPSQNAKAYRKKHGRHRKHKSSPLSDPLKHLPLLPSSLLSFATKPLPTSCLFHKALCSADALDESELHLWEQDPPYNYLELATTLLEECFTKNMVDVLLGQHWRLAKAVRDERTLCFTNREVQGILHEIADVLVGHILRWTKVASHITGMEDSSRNRAMMECWLYWQVWDILVDTKEVKALKNGDNPYCI